MYQEVKIKCPHCDCSIAFPVDSSDDEKDEIGYCDKCEKRFIVEPTWTVTAKVLKVEE